MNDSPKQISDDDFTGLGDDFYDALMHSHEGLTDSESASLNARLLLLLANQIGDIALLRETMRLARESVLAERAE